MTVKYRSDRTTIRRASRSWKGTCREGKAPRLRAKGGAANEALSRIPDGKDVSARNDAVRIATMIQWLKRSDSNAPTTQQCSAHPDVHLIYTYAT